jgi:hypothetical protein
LVRTRRTSVGQIAALGSGEDGVSMGVGPTILNRTAGRGGVFEDEAVGAETLAALTDL